MTQTLNALHTSLSGGRESLAKEASMRKPAGRTMVFTTLEYTPQTRRRRRNSIGTFLAWRSSAGARLTIRSERPPS